ncbi:MULTISPECIES: thiamine-phosphate kinase [unclassified Lysobacter]|uniref:thiamine-phosphate kinase n=1 Tax=unclassified Lysobacter TaxID=2635362 RepID=UPI001BEBF7FB|nr:MULTISPECIES: thiamine-phosphate kinase [unclassified Lysobacter]MBT2747881.1 thiamine-phosphate kinase [Lysobacter sp. ISL-42]MBT2753779.1 thiamine-phosphate kinase [Lysobacter sp. ISL-50]MBT2779067.1 thiamine-phosphate kinase [Lysobacter sp. ISL-54]
MSAAEFDLIARIRARAATREDVVLGIGDDAALLQPPPGRQLVVATDTLNRGVHFGDDAAAADIGWKALAVNLSDLAAMGADPAWCTLSLSLPADGGDALQDFVDGFLDGFVELAAQHRVALVGGDTTRGPLSVCVTVIGFVEPGWALRRDAAQIDDDIWVTGTLGDAAAALALAGIAPYCEHEVRRNAGDAQTDAARLFERLHRPTPRVAMGRALRGLARAGIDISDGLLADLGHVCAASNVGACIDADALPVSAALSAACGGDARRFLQLSGGDDYELCFTAPPRQRAVIAQALSALDTPARVIGRIQAPGTDAAHALHVRLADGSAWRPDRFGYQHFG